MAKWVVRMFIGAALLLFAGCAGPERETTETSLNRIVYGLTLQPSGIDPHINASSELGIPLRQVYDTLVYRDPATREFTAGLASSWSISDDQLTYTFTLRNDVTFHDGTPFNAQAVASTLDRITSPDTGSQRAVFMLGTYIGYTIIDDFTIQIRLSEPYSPLLDSLSQVYLGIASPKALAEYSRDRYQFHQVGTGPFRFVEYIPGERIVLRRNPDYRWGPAFYSPAVAGIDEIEFRFYTDAATRSLALSSGEAQIMGEIPPLDARTLANNSFIQLKQTPIPGQPLQFLINTRRFPTDNLAIRQALLYATNRNAIVDSIFQRFSSVAWGPLSANTLYFNRQLIGAYEQNTAQAQTLLQSAGYTDSNNDGILDIGGLDLEVSIIVPSWGSVPEVAQLLQDQWRTIGVRVRLDPVPTFNILRERVASGEYNLVAYYTFGLDPALLNQFFMTSGSTNWSQYSNPELDRLLSEATRQVEPTVRNSLYAQAQQIIMDAALILPIRDYVNINGASAALQNFNFDAYGWFPILNNMALGSAGA